VKRLLQHTFLLFFLSLTAIALHYTIVRVDVPFIPWPILRFHHGLMAPYQGHTIYNQDLLAEGKIDGIWEAINLDPYYPMILGNRIMTRRLRRFEWEGETLWKEKHQELAHLLLGHEQRNGKGYQSVRLTWQEWPRSPEGWDAMRDDEHVTDYFLAETP
jgi:hypothetical protein